MACGLYRKCVVLKLPPCTHKSRLPQSISWYEYLYCYMCTQIIHTYNLLFTFFIWHKIANTAISLYPSYVNPTYSHKRSPISHINSLLTYSNKITVCCCHTISFNALSSPQTTIMMLHQRIHHKWEQV